MNKNPNQPTDSRDALKRADFKKNLQERVDRITKERDAKRNP